MLRKDLQNLKVPDAKINNSKVFFTLQPSPSTKGFFSSASVSPATSTTVSPKKSPAQNNKIELNAPKCSKQLNFDGHLPPAPSEPINIKSRRKPKNR